MANEPWASDATFPAGADPWSGQPTKVVPDVAEIAAGHTPGLPVPAETENWWKNRTDARLSAIELDFIPPSVDYNLAANTDDADLTGTASLDGVYTVYVTPVAADWNLNGIVGGTDRREIQLVNVGTFFFWLGHEIASSAAANRIKAPDHHIDSELPYVRVYPGGSVRLRYNGTTSRWHVVGMTGCKVRRRFTLPPTAARILSGSSSTYNFREINMLDATAIHFPLGAVLPPGSTLEGWKAYLNKVSANTTTLRARLGKFVGDSTASTSGTYVTNNANAPGFITLPAAGLAAPDVDANYMGELDVTASDPSAAWIIDVSCDVGGGDDLLQVDAVVWVPI